MTVSISLPYGAQAVDFECRQRPALLTVQEPAPAVDAELYRSRTEAFLDQADLDMRRVSVSVGDKTRMCGYPQYLPVLIDALLDRGATQDGITIHIAYGTHPHQSLDICRRIYGPVYDRFRVDHHQCDDESRFVDLGRTQRGTPVRLLSDLMKASCVITFGAISHHYFAGYGGGRKLVFPGLGEKEAIYANHGLFLDPEQGRLAPGCQPGKLNGNPLADDLAEYETYRPADMAVHGILDSHGQVCDLLVGCGQDHFRSACTVHGNNCEADGRQYDLVLASCGGHPKDINFIQSHKAIHNAAAFVRDGGQLIVLAQCGDGIGSQTFLPWFELGGWDEAFDRLSAHYIGNGGTALAMMAKVKRIRIGLVTQLDRDLADKIGYAHLDVDQARKIIGQHKDALAVIPNASMLVYKS